MKKIKIIDNRVVLEKDEQNLLNLVKEFKVQLKLEKQSSDGYGKFHHSLEKFAENESIKEISKMFEEISKAINEINEFKKKLIDLIEQKIIRSIESQIYEGKERLKELKDFEKKKLDYEKKRAAYQDNQSKKKNSEQQLRKEMDELENDCKKCAHSFSIKMTTLITERNEELKAMFQHFINCNLHYYAKGLEKLSELTYFIKNIDDKNDTQNLLNNLLGQPIEQKEDNNKKLNQQQEQPEQLKQDQQ